MHMLTDECVVYFPPEAVLRSYVAFPFSIQVSARLSTMCSGHYKSQQSAPV